jgi:hypothetical protein
MRWFVVPIMLAMMICIVGCDLPEIGIKASKSTVYTLYRTGLAEKPRIHVATFDAYGEEEYNRANCYIAKGLFKNQPGVVVDYWCEKGYFKE